MSGGQALPARSGWAGLGTRSERSPTRARALALALAVGVAGALGALGACAGAARPNRPPPGDRVYAAGLEAYRAGRWDEAIARFRAYLEGAPDDAQAEAARAYLTLAHVGRGDCGAARLALGDLLARHPGGALLVEARDAVARCRSGVGAVALDAAAARRELAVARAAGDAFHAVLYANRLAVAGGVPDEAEREAVAAAVDAVPARWLDDLWLLLEPAAWPASEVALRRVLVAAHVGDAAAARARLGDVRDPALRAEAEAALDALEARRKVDPRVVGVLLPLGGRYAAVGRELRAAIELAAADDPQVKLVFADTAGDETRAAEAVDELVAKAHPILLLGPVGERESAAAVVRAAALGVPIALLSPSEGLADPAAGVFRLVTSGEQRARLVAAAALRLGVEMPAIFAPRDDVGRAQARAFAEAMRAGGAEVVQAGEYDPTATDLEPDVKAFLGLDPARNERLRKHLAKDPRNGWKTFSPDIRFDALFVPDGWDRAALVAAFLVYFNVELRTSDDIDSAYLEKKHRGRPPALVQLLGTPAWHHPELSLRGGAAVQGAYVVDVYAGGEREASASPAAAELADRWRARTGRSPSSIAAEAHDATLLVLGARRAAIAALERAGGGGGADPRGAARLALASATLDDGACGPSRVGPGGEIVRGGVLLRVEGGEFVLEDIVEPVP